MTDRVICCGGRDFADEALVRKVLERIMALCGGTLTVVHGRAPGADLIAGRVAHELCCDVEAHPAKWHTYGRSAGHIRNAEMASAGATLCVAFPGGRGTASMVCEAKAARIPVLEVAADALERIAERAA